MLLFPLFLFVLIINLLWLTQFLAEIRSESTVVGLNVAMVLSWLVFVFLYWNLRIKKSMSSVYEVLVDTKDTTVSVDEKSGWNACYECAPGKYQLEWHGATAIRYSDFCVVNIQPRAKIQPRTNEIML